MRHNKVFLQLYLTSEIALFGFIIVFAHGEDEKNNHPAIRNKKRNGENSHKIPIVTVEKG